MQNLRTMDNWSHAGAIPPAEDMMNRSQAECESEAVHWLTRARTTALYSGRQDEW